MDKIKWTKILGIGGTVLSLVATLISNYASDQKQEKLIEKKVEEALTKRD